MLAVRREGTACENKLSRELTRLHIAFETNARALTNSKTRPDFLFPKSKIAIFIDGCFWHGCPEHGSVPRANRLWWQKKIAENRQRDDRSLRLLRANGWAARRFWSHEGTDVILSTVLRLLKQRAGTDS